MRFDLVTGNYLFESKASEEHPPGPFGAVCVVVDCWAHAQGLDCDGLAIYDLLHRRGASGLLGTGAPKDLSRKNKKHAAPLVPRTSLRFCCLRFASPTSPHVGRLLRLPERERGCPHGWIFLFCGRAKNEGNIEEPVVVRSSFGMFVLETTI